MRKLLLFLLVGMATGITSCTKGDVDEISRAEKEYLVEQMLVEFNKSAIKTGKYQEFTKKLHQRKNDGDLTPEEIEAMVQEFLGEQTQAFLHFYYQLEKLNLTTEEFYEIADQFEHLRLIFIGAEKALCDCTNVNGSLLGDLFGWICGCNPGDDTVGDEGDDTN